MQDIASIRAPCHQDLKLVDARLAVRVGCGFDHLKLSLSAKQQAMAKQDVKRSFGFIVKSYESCGRITPRGAQSTEG